MPSLYGQVNSSAILQEVKIGAKQLLAAVIFDSIITYPSPRVSAKMGHQKLRLSDGLYAKLN